MVYRSWSEHQQSLRHLSESHQHCLAATDPTELFLIIEQFERVVSEGAEPSSWMKAWGDHLANQPFRASVDPQALESPVPSGLPG